MALNKDHGGQDTARQAPPMEAQNGEEAGTVQAPRGVRLDGWTPEGQPGNKSRLH